MQLDSLGVLFSNSWQRYQKRFLTLVSIYLPPLVMVGIGKLLLLQPAFPDLMLGALLSFLGSLLSIAASIGMLVSVGKGTDFIESYRAGFRWFWAYIWVVILVDLALIGGFIMLIVPGILLSFQLALSVYVLVLEEQRGMQALWQSREYTKGYWWVFVGRCLLFLLIAGALLLVIYLPFKLLLGDAAGWLAYGVLFLFL